MDEEFLLLCRSLYEYDPDFGILTIKNSDGINSRLVGSTVSYGTDSITVRNIRMPKASFIWFIHYGVYPEKMIDHIDTNHDNNRLSNLREATEAQNQWNKTVANPHGYKGVTWRNRRLPWLAKIRVNGHRINLGSFATKEEAAEAYREACLRFHGNFAHLRVKA